MPGTEEKLRVLRERADNGWLLFHPDDPRRDRRPVTLAGLASVGRSCKLVFERKRHGGPEPSFAQDD